MRDEITSPANERIKAVRVLADAGVRRREQKYVVEGVRLVEAALDAGVRPEAVLVVRDVLTHTARGRALLSRLEVYQPLSVGERAMRTASATVAPQGVLAVLPLPATQILQAVGPLALVLDGLRDPGNLGTVLRSAWATGLVQVVFTEDCADPFGPKVVRAGMGAHFRLAIVDGAGWEAIRRALAHRPVWLADMAGERAYDEVDWTDDAALIVGGEAAGASDSARQVACGTTHIPMAAGAESLNVGVAASVILFEAARQRRRAAATH
ncbi:MAG: RNA methyltransferase [Chloroflexi bacterium]|nr:RNA methyltransferase [Chloroflexota bacterium]